jgi:hypothetical protein
MVRLRTLLAVLVGIAGLLPNMNATYPIDDALSANLDGDFKVFFSDAPPPSEGAIRKLEAEIGYTLPSDFRESLKTRFGSFYAEVKEEVWPRGKAYDAGPFWSFLYGVYLFSLAEDMPDWLSLRKKMQEFRAETGTKLTPFLKIVGDADVYCFDPSGQIVHWDHETAAAAVVPKKFFEVIADELKELRARKDRKKNEKKG